MHTYIMKILVRHKQRLQKKGGLSKRGKRSAKLEHLIDTAPARNAKTSSVHFHLGSDQSLR